MQCTKEQIEEKKRLALAKLESKKRQKTTHTFYSYENSNVPPTVNVACSKGNAELLQNEHLTSAPLQQNLLNKKSVHNAKQSTHWLSSSSSSPAQQNNSLLLNGSSEMDTKSFFGCHKVISGVCLVISEERFMVDMPYHLKSIETFKTIPSRQYDASSKKWNFHLKDYELLMSKIKQLEPEVTIGKLPNFVLKCLKQPKSDYSKIDLSVIDSTLYASLMPFQKDGVCFGIEKHGRCLIADDMGLGKTFQALALARYYRSDWPVLIASTLSMTKSWAETIFEYLPSVPLMKVHVMNTAKDYIYDADIVIASHDMISKCTDILLGRKFGVFIVDESHVFKNFKAKCTKAAICLAKAAKRIILLSGTPALSRPNELFTQLSMIDPYFFGDFYEYSKRYCDGKKTKYGWDSTGKSNLVELEVLLSKKFMIRRTKDQVLHNLPSKTKDVVLLDSDTLNISVKDQEKLHFLADDFISKKAQEKHSALLTFFSESARIKIPGVCSYIKRILETGEKFLVFAHHRVMMDAICDLVRSQRKKFIRIDGNTPPAQRQPLVDKFQTDDSCVAAVLSITSANAGITLTAARLVLMAELHWNPSILNQAESRAHRIGQEGQVCVKYLLAKDTVDDHIWPMLQKKSDILLEVGLAKDNFKDVSVTERIAVDDKIRISDQQQITDYFRKSSDCEKNKSCDDLEQYLAGDDDLFLNINL